MVATISARGGPRAAAQYYLHLRSESYYAEHQENSQWFGYGCAALALSGTVSALPFSHLLRGLDPWSGDVIVKRGGRQKTHVAGWDITFSAPKSVSIIWALSELKIRDRIFRAHRESIRAALGELEKSYTFCRRGKGGKIRENVGGIVAGVFTHLTSRDLDPQLHAHAYVFNVARRQDGTWGAILSKPIYKAQKVLGEIYRERLATELCRLGYDARAAEETIRIEGVSREAELAFSQRRQTILAHANALGDTSVQGLERATLATRRRKRPQKVEDLFNRWRMRADALGITTPSPDRRVQMRIDLETTIARLRKVAPAWATNWAEPQRPARNWIQQTFPNLVARIRVVLLRLMRRRSERRQELSRTTGQSLQRVRRTRP